MRKRLLAAAVSAAVAFLAVPRSADAEATKITVIVFPGLPNLPIYAAQANGFFAKRDLDIDIKFTPNSDDQRAGLAEGRYQIAHSAVDNAFAMSDKAHVDIAVVAGGDNGFNRLITQPDIGSLADIKGKTVVVDAIDTAYAFQLYEMLRQKGLEKGDYKVNPVGATGFRLEAMLKDRANAAGMMNPPFSVKAEQAGLKNAGSAAAALGAYQGIAVFVRRPWGRDHADALVRYLQAYVEGMRWTLDAANRSEAVALIADRLKLPADVAALTYDQRDGFDRDAAINMAGMRNVLKLRAQYEGHAPAEPDKYLDLSYYHEALAGL